MAGYNCEDYSMNYKLLEQWFEKRFNRKPEQDRDYFEEWKERYSKGLIFFKSCMDYESLKVWKEVVGDIMQEEASMGCDKFDKEHPELTRCCGDILFSNKIWLCNDCFPKYKDNPKWKGVISQ